MRHENRLNVSASRNLKDIGGKDMLGRQESKSTGPVLAHENGKGERGEKITRCGPEDEKSRSNLDESHEPLPAKEVEARVGVQERRPASRGASDHRGTRHEEPSKPQGAYAYLAQPSPPKADMLFRREEARTILVRLLARRLASMASTASSFRKAA